jgi:type III secretory pathway component EscS
MLSASVMPTVVVQRAFEIILWMMLPPLLTLVIVGVTLSLIFTILQINDQALPITAKILTIVTFLVAMGHGMANLLLSFTAEVFTALGQI